MTLSLVEDLKAYSDKNKTARSVGLTVFLAHKQEIQEALEKGYNAKIIWDCLKEKGIVNFTYRTFTVYIKEYICTKQSISQSLPQQSISSDAKPKSFKWNPVPDKDKLI